MGILAFDPGDHTGWALVENKHIVATGEIIYTQKKKLKHMEELIYLQSVRDLYKKFLPEICVIEANFAGKFLSIVKALEKKLTILKLGIKLEWAEALIVEPPPSQWKSALGIPARCKKNLTPEKEKVLMKIKELIPGYNVDNEHITDAIAMGFYGEFLLKKVEKK